MNDLLARLPHQPPAVLLEAVLTCTQQAIRCRLCRDPHPSLAPGGQLPTTLGLEALAQCAAAWMLTQESGRQPEGMLVQCRQFRLHRRYLDVAAGVIAHCQSISPESGLGLSQFQGQLTAADGTVLCEGTFLILNQSRST